MATGRLGRQSVQNERARGRRNPHAGFAPPHGPALSGPAVAHLRFDSRSEQRIKHPPGGRLAVPLPRRRGEGEWSKMDVSGPAGLKKVVVLMSDRDTTLSSKRQLVQAVATITLAACALLLANGVALAAVQAHATTTVAGSASAATPAQTRYDRIALQTLDDIVKGNFTAATARFDATMRTQLPPATLATAWKTFQNQFGRYQSHGDPKDVAFGEFTAVKVPLRMERTPAEFRVTFHKDGSIASLFFLWTGAPVS